LKQLHTNIVAYLLKARTVEPEKQPLLANGSETMFISRQRLGKHGSATADTHAIIETLFGNGVFCSVCAKGIIRKTTGATEPVL
jgi:hypothetical protein